jgi:hypothetical protein
MTTCLTLFAGGGLADLGLAAAGYQSIGGIDNDPTVREKEAVMPKMTPVELYRLLEPLQVGDLTPAGLCIHGPYRWTVTERIEQPAILVLYLEDRDAPQHMFYGYPKCWIATNANKTVCCHPYAEGIGSNKALDLVHQQKHHKGEDCAI